PCSAVTARTISAQDELVRIPGMFEGSDAAASGEGQYSPVGELGAAGGGRDGRGGTSLRSTASPLPRQPGEHLAGERPGFMEVLRDPVGKDPQAVEGRCVHEREK